MYAKHKHRCPMRAAASEMAQTLPPESAGTLVKGPLCHAATTTLPISASLAGRIHIVGRKTAHRSANGTSEKKTVTKKKGRDSRAANSRLGCVFLFLIPKGKFLGKARFFFLYKSCFEQPKGEETARNVYPGQNPCVCRFPAFKATE